MKKVVLFFLVICIFSNFDFNVISKESKIKEDNIIEFTPTNQIETIDLGENIKVEIDSDGIITIKDIPKLVIRETNTQNSISIKNDDNNKTNDKWVLLLKSDKKPYKNNKQEDFDIFDEINTKETKIPTYNSNDLYNIYYETDKDFILSDDLSKNEFQYDLKKLPHQNLKYFYIVLAKYIENVNVAKEKDENNNDKNINANAYFYYAISKTSYELPIKISYESNIEKPYQTNSNNNKSYEYLKKSDNFSTNIPTQNKYKFDGWYTSNSYETLVNNLKTEYDKFTFDENNNLFELKLYAKWVEKTTPKWIVKPIINSFIYGSNAPDISYSSEAPSSFISYSFNGTAYSGEGYNSSTFPKFAGKYEAVFKINESDNYKSLTTKIPFEIYKKEVNLIWNNTKQTYTGKKLLPSVTLNGVLEGDTCLCNVKIREGESIKVGTYTAEAVDINNSNYILPSKNSIPFQIIKKTFIKKINLAEIDRYNNKSYKKNNNSNTNSLTKDNIMGNNIMKDNINGSNDGKISNKNSKLLVDTFSNFVLDKDISRVKKIAYFLILILIQYALSALIGGCVLLYDVKRKRIIKFETNGGTKIKKIKIKKGEKITRPTNPTKEDAIFDAWYIDKECLQKYDFDLNNYKDIKLFANWS